MLAQMMKSNKRYTHNLHPLQKDDTAVIQNQLNHWWNIIGKLIKVIPNCQYQIGVDGSSRITLRNHCFLKKVGFQIMFSPILSALSKLTGSSSDVPVMHSNSPVFVSNDIHATIGHPHIIMPLVHVLHAIKNSLSPI